MVQREKKQQKYCLFCVSSAGLMFQLSGNATSLVLSGAGIPAAKRLRGFLWNI